MDWSSVFDYRGPQLGATQRQLADFATQLFQPLTGQEIADIAAQQRNPFPPNHPLHPGYLPIDASRWRLPPEQPLPPSYLSLLSWTNGGDFGNGERWFQLLPTDGPRGVRATMLAYELPEYMPGALPFAFNGGGVFYLFDLRRPADADGEYPVVASHAGNLGWGTDDECWPVADRLEDACRGRTNIENLACRIRQRLDPAPDLPDTADIYVDQVSPESIEILAQLRKLLGATWRFGDLRGLLACQPFLALKAGHPFALRRKLDQSIELRPYLFYDANGSLESVWPHEHEH